LKVKLKLKFFSSAIQASRPHSKKKVIIECYGGLGNQLLAIFFGLYCSQKYDRLLQVDCLYLDSSRSGGIDFRVFDWNKSLVILNNPPKSHKRLFWQIIDSLSYRIEIWRVVEKRILGIFREVYNPVKTFQDLNELFEFDRAIRLKGYWFQKMFAESLLATNDLKELSLKSPSELFLKMKSNCEEIEPIGVHIRRGDYSKESFGQLDEEYYLQILQDILSKHVSPIWLFVEDDNILSEMPNLVKLASKKLTSKDLPNPAESMLLMSHCKVLILSNSSFSYVAGLLSNGDIYAPWPLRPPGLELTPGILSLESNEIFPETWKIFPSIWRK
jgi:hypothetical protein